MFSKPLLLCTESVRYDIYVHFLHVLEIADSSKNGSDLSLLFDSWALRSVSNKLLVHFDYLDSSSRWRLAQ